MNNFENIISHRFKALCLLTRQNSRYVSGWERLTVRINENIDERKQDELLYMDCNMYAHLGCDSSKKEKQEVRVASRKIYLAIKSINSDLGTLFLQCMDDKT